MRDHGLTGGELAAYRRDGFLVRRSVFDESELRQLRGSVESAVVLASRLADTGRPYLLDGKRVVDVGGMTVQFEHSPGSRTVRVIEPVHQLHEGLGKLVDEPRIVTPIGDILGSSNPDAGAGVAVWTNKLNLKRPKEGSGFGWHQDAPYWIHDCDHVHLLPSVYLAFDDASEGNGCLRIIRGSHRAGCLPGSADGSQLGGFFTDPSCFDEADAVLLAMPAGSLVFFDPHVIHGSGANDSDQPRRAIILTYQPANFAMLKTGEVRNVQAPRRE